MAVAKHFFPVILFVFFCIVPAAPGFAGKPGFDDREIRIAQWGPQTGPAAAWGSIARGSRLLFTLVNEEGGIHGRKIRYFLRDDRYNPAQTKAVVKELVEKEGIFAFVGGVSAAGGLAVKDYLAQNKIPWVAPSNGIKEYVVPVNPYIFTVMPLYEDEASILTKFLVEKKHIKKIGILYQNDPYGKAGLEGCKKRLDHYKMKLVAEIPVEAAEKDLASQVMKLKKEEAEAVLLFVSPATAVVALKTAAATGYKPRWTTSVTLADCALMHKISNGLWEGVITDAFLEPPDSRSRLMIKYREAQRRLDPNERWSFLYTAGILYGEPLVDALKRTGRNLSTEAFLKALNSTKNFRGIGAKITWTPTQHNGGQEVQVWECGPNGTTHLLQNWTRNDLAIEGRKK